MKKLLDRTLDWIYTKFHNDASKMLIATGVIGWALSSIAQAGAILFNDKISKEKKSFLIPQELADAAVNIGMFFAITQSAKKLTQKLFSTGKFAPKKVAQFLKEHPELQDKVGKLDFDLGEVLSKNPVLKTEYESCKNLGTTVATVAAGVVASNIVTPIARNNMASYIHKSYIAKTQNPKYPVTTSDGMKI